MPTATNINVTTFPITVTKTTSGEKLVATRLKPNSRYSVFNGLGVDVTFYASQAGVRKTFDPNTTKLLSDANGRIEFQMWFFGVNSGIFSSSASNIGGLQWNGLYLKGPDNVSIPAPRPPVQPDPPISPPPPVRQPSSQGSTPSNTPTVQPTPTNTPPSSSTPSVTPTPITVRGNSGVPLDEGWSVTRPEIPAPVQTQVTVQGPEFRTPITRSTTTYYNNGTPLSETSLYFDYIQTFYVDPAAVQNSQTVSLTNILLYFKSRPRRTGNQSGITNPGIRVCLCEVVNGEPDLKRVFRESFVKLTYDQVIISNDASLETVVTFSSPFVVRTGNVYGIVINFEDPQYSLWIAKRGNNLVGTETPLTGGYTSGQLFRASNYLEIDSNPNTLDTLYKAETDTDLKFAVNILKYDTASNPTLELVNNDYEFLEIGNITEGPYSSFIPNEDLFQYFGNTAANVTFYKTGNVAVTQNRDTLTGTGTKFNTELQPFDYIVVTDGTTGNSDLRQVVEVISDTSLTVNSPINFTNSTAKVIKTIKGKLDTTHPTTGLFILSDSTASSERRFISDGINDISFSAATGYSNTDYVLFTGGQEDGKALITTNQTGYVTYLNIVEPGYGFTATPTATVYKQDGTLRSPSTITITATPGSRIKGSVSGAVAKITNVTTLSVDHIIPHLELRTAGGTAVSPSFNFAYYDSDNNVYTINESNYDSLQNGTIVDTINYDATILSKSLEILNSSSLTFTEGKSGIIKFAFNTVNPYETPELHADLANLYIFSNQINNDATDEHLPTSGNSITRHISSKITFANYAEDLRVIASMYRPRGTDVKIYTRLYNSKDTDAFDDKYWTELVEKDATFGARYYSSTKNKGDLVEVTFGLPSYPPIVETLDGTARVYSTPGNSTVDGTGTTFDTKIAAGDVVVLYSPTEPSTHAVVLANSITSATSFEINNPLENISLAAATLKVGLLSNSSVNYQLTAFNNILNDNVARYFCTSKTVQDTYNTLAVKIVLLSDTTYLVPRVEDIRVIGVSA